MVWFYVDDGLAFHKKAVEAGNAAMGLWVRAGAWSTGSLTDGFIPSPIARSIGTQTQLDSLLKSGLWRKAPGGYQFHDWHHRQLSKSEIESKREADRKRKREQRQSRNVPLGQPPEVQPDEPPDSEWNQNGNPMETAVDSSRALPRACAPHPTPPSSGQVEGGSHGGLPPPYCDKHMPNGTERDCHPCGVRRQRRTEAMAERSRIASDAARARALAERNERIAEAQTRQQAIDACPFGCKARGGYTPAGMVCDHQQHSTLEGRAEARALVQAALAGKPADDPDTDPDDGPVF
jgi:hypothetical protein